MKLKNGYVLDDLILPLCFDNKICVITDTDLSRNELLSFNLALDIISKVIKNSPPNNNLLPFGIYFCGSENSEFTIEKFDGETVFGCYTHMIIYPIWKWRELHLDVWAMFFVMTEEICHAVWQVPDGPDLKAKVTEVLQIVNPNDDYDLCIDSLCKTYNI